MSGPHPQKRTRTPSWSASSNKKHSFPSQAASHVETTFDETNAQATTDITSSLFMRLPRELRDEVYSYALNIPPGVILKKTFLEPRAPNYEIARRLVYQADDPKADENHLALRPSLLAVNSWVGAEAATALYTQNLIFWNIEALLIFLGDTSFSNRSWLTHIVVGRASDSCCEISHARILMKASHLLRLAAHRLRHLEINNPQFYVWQVETLWDYAVKEKVEEHAHSLCEFLGPILEAVGVVRGSPEAAVDVLRLGLPVLGVVWYQYESFESQESKRMVRMRKMREVKMIMEELLTSGQFSRR